MDAEESTTPSLCAIADSAKAEDSPGGANKGREKTTPSGVETGSKQELPRVTRMMMTVGYMACRKSPHWSAGAAATSGFWNGRLTINGMSAPSTRYVLKWRYALCVAMLAAACELEDPTRNATWNATTKAWNQCSEEPMLGHLYSWAKHIGWYLPTQCNTRHQTLRAMRGQP